MVKKLIAKQMLALIKQMYGEIKPLDIYEKRSKLVNLQVIQRSSLRFFAHYQKMPLMETFLMYGYSIGSTMVQNAVRAIPLGQRDGQVVLNNIIKLLGKLYPEVEKLDGSYLGANVPGLG